MSTSADKPERASIIRRATRDDFSAVMALYRQLNPDDPALSDGSDRAVFEQILDDPALTILVLEQHGRVVGTTYLNVIPNITRSASPYAIIENVVVDAPLRGTGVGKSLIAATLQEAWKAHCYKVVLTTGSKNPNTHAFYRAGGFSADARTAYTACRP